MGLLYIVWARRALNRSLRRFLARAGPHIAKAKDGRYLLYNTGQGMACNTTCTGEPELAAALPPAEAEASEKDAELAQKLGQLQPFVARSIPTGMHGPTCVFWADLTTSLAAQRAPATAPGFSGSTSPRPRRCLGPGLLTQGVPGSPEDPCAPRRGPIGPSPDRESAIRNAPALVPVPLARP
jgi:hypothetical protein